MKLLMACALFLSAAASVDAADLYIRVNQAGFLPSDTKVAVAFSRQPTSGNFELKTAESGRTVLSGQIGTSPAKPICAVPAAHCRFMTRIAISKPSVMRIVVS